VYSKGVGLAIHETDGNRFVAAAKEMLPLEAVCYKDVEAIERAAGVIFALASTA
jgi:hypothetical protein